MVIIMVPGIKVGQRLWKTELEWVGSARAAGAGGRLEVYCYGGENTRDSQKLERFLKR